MAKKDNNISISTIKALLKKTALVRGSSPVRSLSCGMNSCRTLVPADVISWITDHDLSPEGNKYHSRYVLKIPLNGSNISCLDGKLFELTPGNALLIFPYQLHSNPPMRQNDRSTEFLLVTFCLPLLEGQQYLAPLKNTLIPLKENWFKRILQITRSYQNPDEVSEAEAVFNLAGVLAEMAESFPKQEKTEENMEIFTRICDYIKDNFHNGLNVNILAEQFSVSQTTVRRLFSKNFGKNVTPAHFIENVRIQNAIMRLLHSDDSIAEIAAKCGYSNQFGFSRVFKRATGASPREYRTLHKKST